MYKSKVGWFTCFSKYIKFILNKNTVKFFVLKDAQKMAEDADKKYDEASKKMTTCEAQLEVHIHR